MDTLIGVVGKGFVLTTADSNAGRSVLLFKSDEDKTRDLGPHLTMLFCGESGDTVNFAEFIQKNIRLYAIRNNLELSPHAAAHFIRTELAQSIRSRSPYIVNALVAGYDKLDGPELYWMDYMGTIQKMPFAAHGHASYFVLATLDRHYRPNMELPEAIQLLKNCISELRTRFIINQSRFLFKVVDANGVRVIEVALDPLPPAAGVTAVPIAQDVAM